MILQPIIGNGGTSVVLFMCIIINMGLGMKTAREGLNLEFIANFLKWQFPHNSVRNVEKCLVLNFGSTHQYEDLPVPMVSLNLAHDIPQPHITASTNNCLLVLIGGKYVDNIDAVMRKVKSVSSKIGILPKAIFNTNKESETTLATSSIPVVKKYFRFIIINIMQVF